MTGRHRASVSWLRLLLNLFRRDDPELTEWIRRG